MNDPQDTNLAQLFRSRSAQYAQAVRWRQRCGQSWRRVTFAEQQRLVNQLISGLDAIAALLDDLAKSLLKRGTCVKDSGTILPGHGSILDCADSMLSAVLVVFFYPATHGGLR